MITKEQIDEIVIRKEEGFTFKEIKRDLEKKYKNFNLSIPTIKYCYKGRENIANNQNYNKSKEIYEENIIKDRRNGKTLKELSNLYGISKSTVSRICIGEKVVIKYKRVLTEEQVKVIRKRRLNEKVTLAELAKEYNVSISTMSKITSDLNARKLSKDDMNYIKNRITAGDSIGDIAKVLKISSRTLYRYLQDMLKDGKI